MELLNSQWLHMLLTLLLLFFSPCNFHKLRRQSFPLVPSPSDVNNSDAQFLPAPGDTTSRPVVTIRDGALRGFTLRTINGRPISAFQSIPFAEPPIGWRRFRDPVRNRPWRGVRDALPRSPECTGTQFDSTMTFQVNGQEDCLYLNVYTPQGLVTPSRNVGLPVMVFIPGGGFSHGSGTIYGPRYLLNRDVILVTLNYRLGPLGFLSTGDDASPGNQALKDQVLALKWVQENIAAFGGNPNSITLFGNSAGASSVIRHLVAPASRGLFHRAIAQSIYCDQATRHNATVTAKMVGEYFNCPVDSSWEMVDCLRKVPHRELVSVQHELVEWLIFPYHFFAPTVEHEYPGAFMTKSVQQYYEDGEAADIPLISGLNSHEMSFMVSRIINQTEYVNEINQDWDRVGPAFLQLNFGSEERDVRMAGEIWDFYMGDGELSWETRHDFSRMYGDRLFTECTLESIRLHSMYSNKPVYTYHFSYQGQYSVVQQYGGRPEDWGVAHVDEMIYLLNNPDMYPPLRPGDSELEMSEMMTGIWSNYSTFDKPLIPHRNGTLGTWRPIDKCRNKFSPLVFLDLNLKPEMIEDPYVKRYNFWRSILDSTF